jgi:GTP-binding protein
MKFIDEVKITIQSGRGGPGSVSFRREKWVPRGGPDGGDGGRGGNVIFKVNSHLNTLLKLRFKSKLKANDGQAGMASQKSGADGQDLIVEVPAGTVITTQATNERIDLSEEHQEIVLLKGGRGGKGNMFFKTSVNQAPDHAQPGEDGEVDEVHLELKLMADVGIIGFPNAGKSTFISKVSSAKPKIADYPFTTLTPNLGVVRVDEENDFVIADIPGLIPGAHKGAGLGIQFLRHIERTKCFVHMVDVSMMTEGDALENYFAINQELKAYDEQHNVENPLSSRNQIVVLNKIDLIDREELETIERKFKAAGIEPHLVSGLSGYGIKELIYKIFEMTKTEKSSLQ